MGVVQGGYRPHGLRAAKQSRGRVPTGTSSETSVAVSAWGRRRETAGQRASPGGAPPDNSINTGRGGAWRLPCISGDAAPDRGYLRGHPGCPGSASGGAWKQGRVWEHEKKGRPAAQR